MNKFFFIFIYLIISAINLNAIEDKNCKKIGNEIENRMKIFMFMDESPILPIDGPSLKKYCDGVKPIVKELKAYRKCVDAFSKQVITIILPNLIKVIKRVCSTNVEATIINMKCANKELQLKYKGCFKDFAVRTKYIAYKLNESEAILSGLCCNFHSMQTCLLQRLVNACKNPKANLAKYLADYTSAIGQEVVNFSCAKYQTYKICENQGVVNRLAKYKESDVIAYKEEFFLIPLIKGTQSIVRD